MDIEEARERERNKYEELYKDPRKCRGVTWVGTGAKELIKELKPTSILDVGTGRGSFPRWLWEEVPSCMRCWGIDFVMPPGTECLEGRGPRQLGIWEAPAHRIGESDGAVEWVTAFDVLEHLLPEEVDEVLEEFWRVARKGLILSICYKESRLKVDGVGLHMTVRDEGWWKEKIGGNIEKRDRILVCRKEKK